MKILWLIILVLGIVIELLSASFFAIWFSAGALVAIILSYLDIAISYQLIAFILVVIIGTILTRPIFKKLKYNNVQSTKEQLIGKKVIVVDEISEIKPGRIKDNGIFWNAKANQRIKKNEVVVIKEVQGNTVIVEHAKEQNE